VFVCVLVLVLVLVHVHVYVYACVRAHARSQFFVFSADAPCMWQGLWVSETSPSAYLCVSVYLCVSLSPWNPYLWQTQPLSFSFSLSPLTRFPSSPTFSLSLCPLPARSLAACALAC